MQCQFYTTCLIFIQLCSCTFSMPQAIIPKTPNTLLHFPTFMISSKLFGSSMGAVSVRVLCDSV